MKHVSILIPARNSEHCIAHTVDAVCAHFTTALPNISYEVVIVPNRPAGDLEDKTESMAHDLAAKHSSVRVVPHHGQPGIGAALRTGYYASRGEWVFTLDADLPFQVDFFSDALRLLQSGFDFVTANRRHSQSYLICREPLLAKQFVRDRLGALFNWWVRTILRIDSLDTQAGMKGMSSRFASAAFVRQTCSHFFVDIEYFLTAQGHGFKRTELPVDYTVNDSNTTVKFWREFFLALYWLPKLRWQKYVGHYSGYGDAPGLFQTSPPSRPASEVFADDWGLTPGINSGTLELCKQGLVRGVAMMANSRYLGFGLEELKSLPEVKLGLHFDLTSGLTPEFPSKIRLILFLLNPFQSKATKTRIVEAELERQLATLEERGVRVTHMNGRHHVHLIPGVVRALERPLKKRGIRRVRFSYDPHHWGPSRIILNVLSVLAQRPLRAAGLEWTPFYYPTLGEVLQTGNLSKQLMRRNGYEVLVHPANADDMHLSGTSDPYAGERCMEFESLKQIKMQKALSCTP